MNNTTTTRHRVSSHRRRAARRGWPAGPHLINFILIPVALIQLTPAVMAPGGRPSVPGAAPPDQSKVSRGPYLQLCTPTSVVVRWRTNSPTDSGVKFGTSPNQMHDVIEDVTKTTEHEITLTGLLPATRYYYSIGTTKRTLAGKGGDLFFATSPVPGTQRPVRVLVLGDSGGAQVSGDIVRDAV